LASPLILPFIQAADSDNSRTEESPGLAASGAALKKGPLFRRLSPAELSSVLNLQLPNHGTGEEGMIDLVKKILQYSVNTWDQGFMDKLYSSTNPVRPRS